MPLLAALFRSSIFPAFVWLASAPCFAQPAIPGATQLPADAGDLSALMVAGIDRFLERETLAAAAARDASPPIADALDLQARRDRLARLLGVVDPRPANIDLEFVGTLSTPSLVAETDRLTIHAVRWPALDGLHGEGLLLRPKGPVRARVIAVPDADQLPELLAGLAPGLPPEAQYARRLAENGCEVVIPALVDRADTFSGNPTLSLRTNHPHREWIYRQSFVLGRHVIGYELQKILALVDCFARLDRTAPTSAGIVGWGEGGLLALHAAALEPRLAAAVVSGHFQKRDRLWREPIYRNAFGLLREFADAELARLVAPRSLLIEHALPPRVDGPPPARPGRSGAAPGRLDPIAFADARDEFLRARRLAGPLASSLSFHHGPGDSPVGPLAPDTLHAFLKALAPSAPALLPPGPAPRDLRPAPDVNARQERLVRDMERFTQRLVHLAADERDAFLWKKVPPTTPEVWRAAMRPYRELAWTEMIGRLPPSSLPLNPRVRQTHDHPTWTAHDVVLDVLPDVIAWGSLLLPKNLRPGERRPVVVAQHGVGGLPASVMDEDPRSRAHATYKAFAVQLVERGFIVFAPHNPYRGDDASRVLQRKAQPLGWTIFSFILAQHDRILDFLSTLPSVDPSRIGFYGLSYGGQTAMRVPVLLERYALAICSGDFNEWTWKNTRTDFSKSYMYNAAYERPEFRLGLTFGYAEMAALMVPRPFMVERGHDDGVGIDEWVAYEYAKVFRLYNRLKIPDRTAIEYFEGPHTIHGVGTFRFLHRHLAWPEPNAP